MLKSTTLVKRSALLAGLSITLGAADFTFFTTMQAGFAGNLSYELGAGSTAATTQARSQFGWDPLAAQPHWRNGNLPQSFEIGFRQSTNSGFVRVMDQNNTAITASFTNPGIALGTDTTWTIPTANFFATASSFLLPASVSVENMTFSSGVQILSGSLPASIGAATSGGGGTAVTNSLSAPIVISTASSGGDWTLAGTIRFSGLFGSGGFAFGNQLGFSFGASGADNSTPESSSAFLIGAGLIALGCLHQRRSRQKGIRTGSC